MERKIGIFVERIELAIATGHIHDVAKYACDAAAEFNCRVTFTFNGTDMEATPTKTAVELVSEYIHLREAS